MNTENLYFGNIRKVTKIPETSTEPINEFSSSQNYTFLKEKNGKYKDIKSILGKYYKITFENVGDSFVIKEQLIPYRQLDRINTKKSRRQLLKELKELKKEFLEEINTSKFFVGYVCQIIKIKQKSGTGDTLMIEVDAISNPIKKTIFYKKNYYTKDCYTYVDLDTGIEYLNYGLKIGDTYVQEDSEYLIPFNFYLSPEEKNTRMTKFKALSRFNEIKKQTSQTSKNN